MGPRSSPVLLQSSDAPAVSQRLRVYLAACLLSLALLLALAVLAWYERNEALSAARARAELMSRVLEDQITRAVEAASLSLRVLAESPALPAWLAADAAASSADAATTQAGLRQALQGQTVLRSVALLSPQGRVLASSEAGEAGLQVELSLLGNWPGDGVDRLSRMLPGRGVRDLRAGPVTSPVSMLPLLRQLNLGGGRRLLLLALINPDTLANYQSQALADLQGAALLSSFDGQLLASSESVPQAPGSRLSGHPVFSDWLPAREFGSYVGAGAVAGTQVVAFRASRTRPLVLLVEQPVDLALQSWRDMLYVLLGIAVAGTLLIAGATWVVLRSLRSSARGRAALSRAHERVAAREQDLRVLLRSLQEFVFRTDASGAISFVNARWASLSALPSRDAQGLHLADLVVPEHRARVQALFDPRGPLEEARTAQFALVAPDGRMRRFEMSVLPLQEARGQGLTGFAGSAVDVTERCEAQQSLQHQLAFSALLQEMSPLPVSMFDAAGRYVTVNQAWEEFTGRSRFATIGQEVGGFMPKAERSVHDDQDARLLREGGRIRYETQIKHRDGSLRDMLITKVRVPDQNGGVAGILCTLEDVSEFRAAERATREARDVAQEASRAKSEFVANISHELRTPLQSILGFSELGLARSREQPKLGGMFQDIQQAGQRMLALVNDLLDVSKIESAVGTFDLERCDLRGLIQGVMRELEPLMARRTLRLSLRQPATPLAAKVDPLRFQQVIRNVMANAIKFSPEGGALDVRAALTPQGEVHITVADQGPGIPQKELEKIFDAFVQSSQTKDGSGGTGLGLAICRKIIEVHGGRIYAENRVDDGSDNPGAIFHIYLPLRQPGDSQLMGNLD
ncbi:PAS domain S-box protein [Paucibacter sp. DJ1R-11]|uniref:PAS domain S-box protein n=1 Tax=Paucibacter sp. DJ1R-11 TaxID=2893556 RepID=UPI0021E39DEA|nr:PAS domain S-box protein [Paucibacter sp. DJ1R-11]MCV2364912.1 PAS domain S-box protein [Paucibacter sp. DJ1R-11]